MITAVKSVLAVAVHPDDETLGCGGTLLRLAQEGTAIHLLIVTSAHSPAYDAGFIEQQRKQVRDVMAAHPFITGSWSGYETCRLDKCSISDLVKVFGRYLENTRPEWVFLPHHADVHSDHRVVFNAMSALLKPVGMRLYGVNRVLSCETISGTEAAMPIAGNTFLPTVYVDITSTIERKLEITSLYETELQPEPNPRSLSAIRALARYRGASVGVEYAEAFALLRELL